jgi:hypothetical protein
MLGFEGVVQCDRLVPICIWEFGRLWYTKAPSMGWTFTHPTTDGHFTHLTTDGHFTHLTTNGLLHTLQPMDFYTPYNQ